jgi:photosystem II stability/assembly factor-like uncharacterized protein
MTLIFVIALMLIAVALQIEKPAIRLYEERPERLATHFRKIAFAPDMKTVWAAGFNGLIVRSDDAGKSWKQQVSGTKARLYGLHVFDQNTVYTCGSEGTLLFTSNGGKTWIPIQVPTRLRLTEVYFIDGVRGWVVGDDGIILATRDRGRTWTTSDSGYTTGLRSVWFSDETHGYVAGYEGLLLRTTDGGESWERIQVPEHISFYGTHFDKDKQFHLVGSCGLILESDDAGSNWLMNPVITTNYLRDIDFGPNGLGCVAGYGVILTRHPESHQWQRAADFPGLHLQSIAVGSGGTAIAVGHWGAILRTEDYGKSWILSDQYFSPDMYDIATNEPTGTTMAVGADGWVLMRRQHDGQWIASHTGSRETLRSVAVDQAGRFWTLGGSSDRVYRYTPEDSQWEPIHLKYTPARNLNAIVFKGKTDGFIVGDSGFLMSTGDIGNTWSPRNLPTRYNARGIQFIDDQNGFIYGDNGLALATRNGGVTWMGQFTGVTDSFLDGTFGEDGHAVLLSPFGTLESWSNGYNASWFELQLEYPAIAVTTGGRYLSKLNGEIFDRKTGVSRRVSNDPIFSFTPNHSGLNIWGAGSFGRITRLRSNEFDRLLVKQHRE